MTRTILAALAGFVTLVAPGAGAAEDGNVTPPPGERPVPVSLGLWIVSISQIDEILSTFRIEADVISSWTDPRLAYEPADGEPVPRVYQGDAARQLIGSHWNPAVYAANALQIVSPGRLTFRIWPDGRCNSEARIQTTLRAPLDFRRFPFDEQSLYIHAESFPWDHELVKLVANAEHTGFAPDFSLTEWTHSEMLTETALAPRGRNERRFSRLTFELPIERRTGFYVWKIIVPLFTIVLISWVVFWMKEEGLGRRAGVSATGMLTVIAYQFIVAGALPKVPYLTAIDRIILASLLTIAGTMITNVIVAYRPVPPGQVHRVDRAARWLFPLFYVATVLIIAVRNGII